MDAKTILARLVVHWRSTLPSRLLPLLDRLLASQSVMLIDAIQAILDAEDAERPFAERHPEEPTFNAQAARQSLAQVEAGTETWQVLRTALEAAGVATYYDRDQRAAPPTPYLLLDLPATRSALAWAIWRPTVTRERKPGSAAYDMAVEDGLVRVVELLKSLGFSVKRSDKGARAAQVFRRAVRRSQQEATPSTESPSAHRLLDSVVWSAARQGLPWAQTELDRRRQALRLHLAALSDTALADVDQTDPHRDAPWFVDELAAEYASRGVNWHEPEDRNVLRFRHLPKTPETKLRERAEKERADRRAAATPSRLKSCGAQCDLVMTKAIACGAEAGVAIPSGSGPPTIIPARYCLVRASDVLTSHDPRNGFAANDGYPAGLQERRYGDKGYEQMAVLNIARNPRPEIIFSTNLTAVDGTPIVTPGGVALGGNKRTMGIVLNYANGGEAFSDYLHQVAPDFGITPEEVDEVPVGHGDGPMIVRVVDLPPAQWKQAMRALNTGLTQALDSLTEAVAIGKQFPPEAFQVLAHALAEDDMDITEFLKSERSRPFVAALLRTHVITQVNAGRMLDHGLLSESGREIIKAALSAAVVPDARILEAAGSELRNALARSAPYWLAASAYGNGWDIRPAMLKAVQDTISFRSSGLKTLDRWTRQTTLLDPPVTRGDPMAERLMEILDERRGPVQLSKMARAFAHEAAQFGGGQVSLLQPKTPLEVLKSNPGGPQSSLFAEGMASPSAGRKIRDAREAAGLSLRALAKQINVTNVAYADIERGIRKPSVEERTRLQEALPNLELSCCSSCSAGKACESEGMAWWRKLPSREKTERSPSEAFPGRFVDELNEAELEAELMTDPDYRRAKERDAKIEAMSRTPQTLFGKTRWPGTVLVSPDPSGTGWRATYFDPEQEPTGHVGPTSFETLLRDIIPTAIQAEDLHPLSLRDLKEGMRRFSAKDDRRARHIAASYEERGVDSATAERIGWATVQRLKTEGMSLPSEPPEDLDFFPFGEPSTCRPPARVSTRKAGPRSLNRSDAAIAAKDNARVMRTPPKSQSKVEGMRSSRHGSDRWRGGRTPWCPHYQERQEQGEPSRHAHRIAPWHATGSIADIHCGA